MSPGHDTDRLNSIVFIVDDDALSRDALSSVLRAVGWQVRAFASAAEYMTGPRPAQPACLLLATGPAGENLELQRTLKERGDGTPIIFMGEQIDVRIAVRAMKAGAFECLSRPFGDGELFEAVRLALQRDELESRQRGQILEWRRRIASLSPREQQVMRRVVRGVLNKQIAEELDIAEITVKVHRRHVMDKMGAESLAELVRMVDRAEPGPG